VGSAHDLAALGVLCCGMLLCVAVCCMCCCTHMNLICKRGATVSTKGGEGGRGGAALLSSALGVVFCSVLPHVTVSLPSCIIGA